MKTGVEKLTDVMAHFLGHTAIRLPDDVIAKLEELRDKEDHPLAKVIYRTMFRNQRLAEELQRPSCQDTGVPQYWVRCGTAFPYINELEDLLMQKGIFLELVTGNIIMCMSGIGNTRSDFARLLTALREITAARKPVTAAKMAQPPALTTRLECRALPREKILVPLAEAAGKICASSLIPYPPGVPIACPGEVLTEEVLAYVKARRDADEKVIGITADGYVFVGK